MLESFIGVIGYYWNMPFRELVHSYFFIKAAGIVVVIGLFLIARMFGKNRANSK